MAELLGIQFDFAMHELSEKIFEYQLQEDPKLSDKLTDIAKQRMLDDVVIDITFSKQH